MAVYLYRGNAEAGEAYLLSEIAKSDAVVWLDSITQYSAVSTAVIHVSELELEPPVEPGIDARCLVIDGEEEDGLLVGKLVAEVTAPYCLNLPECLKLAGEKNPNKQTPGVDLTWVDPLPRTFHGWKRDEVRGKLQSHATSSVLVSADRLRDAAASSEKAGYLVWWDEGGYQGWCVQVVDELRAKDERKMRATLRALHDSGTAFINPYTFIPLPDKVERSRPRCHVGSPDLLIGTISLTYETTTDLLMPVDWKPNKKGQPQQITLPGSGIKGAVRSLHEVLAQGCMRVVNLDFRPVHRETTGGAKPENRLAVVTKVDGNDHVTEIQLTEQPIWIPWRNLKVDPPGSLRSGQRFTIVEPGNELETETVLKRRQYEHAITVKFDPNGQWVMHLSDSGARQPKHRYWVAIGRLTDERQVITPEIRQEFEYACTGAGDVKRHQLASTAPAWGTQEWPGVPVAFGDQSIGERRKVTGRLGLNDSVWWDGSDKRLKMALIWRKAAAQPLADRVPSHAKGCDDPDTLCPSCQVFGAAGSQGDGERDGQHRAFGGRVRFLPAISTQEVVTKKKEIAPLREPRPGSGAFYLQTPQDRDLKASGKKRDSKSYWGSELDSPEPRQIRGRKFYWHGQVDGPQSGGQDVPRQFQRNKGIDDPPRWLVPAGTTFTEEVTFDGLDDEQLGLLLCALNPNLLKDIPGGPQIKGDLALHFGGGKPLGFGTVVCRNMSLSVTKARLRYGQRPDTDQNQSPPAPIDYAKRTSIDTAATWFTALVHVLDTSFVDADRIHYPFDPESKDGPSFEKGMENPAFLEAFHFFAAYGGALVKKGEAYEMIPLPSASELNQYIEPGKHIHRTEGRKK